jgi:hypothetical protein
MTRDPEDVVRSALADAAASVTSEPPDPATLRNGIAPQRGRVPLRRVWLPALATAAAVAVVSTATVLVLHGNGSSGHGAGAPPPTTGSAGRPSTGPAACTGSDLAPTIDPSRTGPANGTENVIILLRNTGAQPCRLAGLVTLRGVMSNGSTVGLGFHSSLDPGYADPAPATGPGTVAPGALGALHLTLQLNDCATPVVHYARLQIRFASGSSVAMSFPAQLALSGCYGFVAQPGPVATR